MCTYVLESDPAKAACCCFQLPHPSAGCREEPGVSVWQWWRVGEAVSTERREVWLSQRWTKTFLLTCDGMTDSLLCPDPVSFLLPSILSPFSSSSSSFSGTRLSFSERPLSLRLSTAVYAATCRRGYSMTAH